ncbi:MAG: micrococcal nuclease [bacterium]|jgi:micrococcal nuclease
MRISSNSLFWVALFFIFGFSAFFTTKVFLFKSGLYHFSEDLVIFSGQEIKIQKIIDGDEVSATFGKKKFVVRLLGVKSYEAKVNDTVLQNVAKLSFSYLEKNLLNKNVTISFDKLKQDSSKRILAYLYVGERDIGAELIQKGLTLVYNRYPFLREKEYQNLENISRQKKNGLWSIEKATFRSLELKKLWEKRRKPAN